MYTPVVCADMQVGTAEAVLQTGSTACCLRSEGVFRVFVRSNTATTQSVSVGFCNGGTFPVYLQSSGAQSTGANFVAGVSYLVTWDPCSGKFFLVGF